MLDRALVEFLKLETLLDSLTSAVDFSDKWAFAGALVPVLFYILSLTVGPRRSRAVPLPTYGWLPPGRSNVLLERIAAPSFRLLGVLALVPILAGMGRGVAAESGVSVPSALMIVLDVSSSMTAEDFKPDNRLQEAKRDLKEFVEKNAGVEIGLIVFAASPQLRVPLTPDHRAVIDALDLVGPAGYGEDGTAIGSGIAGALNRLRSGDWSERSILLITDGVNNRGAISPLDASRLARELNISVHAIGIGTDGLSRYYVPSPTGGTIGLRARIEIDDEALAGLARESAGTYRRVRSPDELRTALLEIQPARPSPLTVATVVDDLKWNRVLALLSLVLLIAEFVVIQLIVSEIPGW